LIEQFKRFETLIHNNLLELALGFFHAVHKSGVLAEGLYMGRYLSLDMGAESGRLVIVDISPTKISTEIVYRFETPIVQDDSGRRCWNFPVIVEEVIHALSLAAPHGPFRSLGVDTWGLDFGLLDSNYQLITLPVSHRDHRTDGFLAAAAREVGFERLHGDTGTQLLEINSIYQLLAAIRQSPEEIDQAHFLLLMPDLILHALTGKIGTEYTIASTTGFYDTQNNDWAYQLLKDLGIPTRFLTTVEDAGTVRGVLKDNLQELTGIGPLQCIATTSHDTASAVVATPLESPGSAYISSGTWSLMGVEIDQPIISEVTLSERLTNEGGFDRSIRLLRNITGLWIIQEVRRDLKSQGVEISYIDLVKEAKSVENPWRTLFYVDAPIFVYAGGMISRIQEYAAKTGQPVPQTPGEIAQATFASLALQYAYTADILAECSGLAMPAIHIVGGGAQNEHLSQMTADLAQREVITGPIEATAIGNAIVQAISVGEISGIESARELISVSNESFGRFQPVRDQKVRQRIDRVRALYENLIARETQES
jgi:rhamnulokinase